MNYEEFFTKYPDMGWIENGEPHFSLSAKINPEATYWVDNAGDVYYYNCKRVQRTTCIHIFPNAIQRYES